MYTLITIIHILIIWLWYDCITTLKKNNTPFNIRKLSTDLHRYEDLRGSVGRGFVLWFTTISYIFVIMTTLIFLTAKYLP